MFEKATKLKLRYATVKGNLTTEDLWDLPLLGRDGFCLDNLAKSLNKQIKENEGHSFVLKQEITDEIVILKLDIVKHIISVKLAEIDVNEKAIAVKEKKQRIMDILAEKEDDSLKDKSVDELKDLLADLH